MEAGRSPTRDPSHSHGNRGVGEVSSIRVDSGGGEAGGREDSGGLWWPGQGVRGAADCSDHAEGRQNRPLGTRAGLKEGQRGKAVEAATSQA